MGLTKLSQDEISARPEYVRFLKGLQVGEGARATTMAEGVGKATLKQRLMVAARAAGVTIKFQRTDPDTVILEVVGKSQS